MTDLGPDAFDFWLGEWDCAFEGGHAVNTVTREYVGSVIWRWESPPDRDVWTVNWEIDYTRRVGGSAV